MSSSTCYRLSQVSIFLSVSQMTAICQQSRRPFCWLLGFRESQSKILRYVHQLCSVSSHGHLGTSSAHRPRSYQLWQAELKLPVSQSLALFVKVIRKLAKHLEGLRGSELANQIPTSAEAPAPDLQPVGKRLSDELAEGAQDFDDQLKRQQREAVDALQPEQ